jgi:hypothetical protein
MKNPGLYIGVVVTSEEEDGSTHISMHRGLSYPNGMDDYDVAVVEDILTTEFGEEYDALQRKVDKRMSEVGLVVGQAKREGKNVDEAMDNVRKRPPVG